MSSLIRAQARGAAPTVRLQADRGRGTPSPEAGERWLIGGVTTELASRLQASRGFIRLLFVLAGYFQFWLVVAVYCALALALPHRTRRRPDWANLVALLRVVALLVVGELSFRWVSFSSNGVFSESPSVWIPVAGTALAAWVVVLSSGRPARGVPTGADRQIVLSVLAPIAVAAGVAAVALLFPGARAERVLDLALVALGLLGGIGNRLNRRAFLAACLPCGLLAVLLAGSGASLSGGVGGLVVVPRRVSSSAHSYRRAVGDVRLDLADLHPVQGARPAAWSVNVGIGRVELYLPSDALTTVHVSIGSGTLNWGYLPLGGYQDRFMLRRTIVVTPRQASGGTALKPRFRLTVNATVGEGCVALESASSQGSC